MDTFFKVSLAFLKLTAAKHDLTHTCTHEYTSSITVYVHTHTYMYRHVERSPEISGQVALLKQLSTRLLTAKPNA